MQWEASAQSNGWLNDELVVVATATRWQEPPGTLGSAEGAAWRPAWPGATKAGHGRANGLPAGRGIRLSALSAIECAAYVVGQEMTRDERGENRTKRKCREADKCAET